jgi:predicted 3-demethylubiquinone-9 3-methyltransferase (glyoxalase superfamily)
MAEVTPFLWFDGRVAEAVDFYTSVFDESAVLETTPGPDGGLSMARFQLAGQNVIVFNGGPHFALTPAFSMFLEVGGQEEVDYYWNALTEGGEPSQCGWLVDRFGVSWQVIPEALGRLMGDEDAERSGRVVAAMLAMSKIVVADLQAAYDG